MPGASILDKAMVLSLAAKQGESEGQVETKGGERRGKEEEQRRGALDNQAANSPILLRAVADGARGGTRLWRSALPGSTSA